MKIITYLCTIKLKITVMKKIYDYSVLISIALLIIAFGLYLVYFMIKDNVYLNIIAIPFVFVVIALIIGMLLNDLNKKEKLILDKIMKFVLS